VPRAPAPQGVPKFYRWISERYPLINQAIDDATLLPVFDNLYLDMNGVIHGATHGDGLSKSLTDEEVMHKMFSYIDTMVKITRPQKLIYFAVDGVAPRAKMNQQRSRRFRAAKDAAEAREEARARGESIADEDLFDSNQITPGTPFMARVSKQLQYYIRRRLRDDPVWRDLRVIFSGHEVPGEGEHKIVEWIRGAKSAPGWDPNTRHVMAGLDADLVMLALAVHEPHFSLLREQIDFMGFRNSKHDTKSKTRAARHVKWQLLHIGVLREYLEMDLRPAPAQLAAMPFPWDGERCLDDFVLLTALCGNDFIPHLPSLDIGEGALDKLMELYRRTLPTAGGWFSDRGIVAFDRLDPLLVAMGEEEEGVMERRDVMMEKHIRRKKRDAVDQKRLFGRVTDPMAAAAAGEAGGIGEDGAMESYLLEAGARGDGDEDDDWVIAGSAGVSSRMPRGALSAAVEGSFAARQPMSPADLLARGASSMAAATASMATLRASGVTDDIVPETDEEVRARAEQAVGAAAAGPRSRAPAGEDDAAAAGAAASGAGAAAAPTGDAAAAASASTLSPTTRDAIARAARHASSLTRRERHYLAKFGLVLGASPPVPEHEAVLVKLRRCFGEALQWVMLYYYQGCPSWGWFFPFHYAPMVSDLVGMGEMAPYTFDIGTPFRPFQQLLGCLPAASSNFLPGPYRWLMTSAESPLLDFYPGVGAIRVDMDGKKNPWEGVTVIPFIREARMLAALAAHAPDASLTADELQRNSFGTPYEMVRDPATLDTLASPIVLPVALAGTDKGHAKIRASDFPDIRRCRTRQERHVEPVLPPAGFDPVPPPGCLVPAPGYPTLHSLPLVPVRCSAAVNIFGFESRKDSVVLAASPQALRAAYLRSHLRPGPGESPHLLVQEDDAPDGAPPQPLSDDTDGLVVPHLPSFSAAYIPTTCVLPPDGARTALARAVSGDSLRDDADDHPAAEAPLSLHAADVTAAEAASLLGTVVHAGWPHLTPALVVAVSDPETTCVVSDLVAGGHTSRRNSPEEASAWATAVAEMERTLLSGTEHRRLTQCGVAPGHVTLVVRCLKLVGMSRDPHSGAVTRSFAAHGSPGDVLVPAQLVLADHPAPDARFVETAATSPVERFAPGARVVILSGAATGESAIVVARDPAAGTMDVALASAPAPEPAFGAGFARMQEEFMPTHEAAAAAGVSPGVFGNLAGTMKVGRSRDGVDIGLNLKVNRDLFLPGYARPKGGAARAGSDWSAGAPGRGGRGGGRGGRGGRGGGGRDGGGGGGPTWEYSKRAAELVGAYASRYPAVVEAMESSRAARWLEVQQVGGGAALEAILAWKAQLATASRPLVPVGTQVMAPSAVRLVEGTAAKLGEARLRGQAALLEAAEDARTAADAGGDDGAAGAAVLARLASLGIAPVRIDGLTPGAVFLREDDGFAVGEVGGGEGMGTTGAGGGLGFGLGARVCNLADTRAPLGIRGTVVAVHVGTGYVEVVWDAAVDGGSSLNGLCSPGRGALCRSNALLPVAAGASAASLSAASSSSSSSSSSSRGPAGAGRGAKRGAGRGAQRGAGSDAQPTDKRAARRAAKAEAEAEAAARAAPAPAPAAAPGSFSAGRGKAARGAAASGTAAGASSVVVAAGPGSGAQRDGRSRKARGRRQKTTTPAEEAKTDDEATEAAPAPAAASARAPAPAPVTAPGPAPAAAEPDAMEAYLASLRETDAPVAAPAPAPSAAAAPAAAVRAPAPAPADSRPGFSALLSTLQAGRAPAPAPQPRPAHPGMPHPYGGAPGPHGGVAPYGAVHAAMSGMPPYGAPRPASTAVPTAVPAVVPAPAPAAAADAGQTAWAAAAKPAAAGSAPVALADRMAEEAARTAAPEAAAPAASAAQPAKRKLLTPLALLKGGK